MIFYSWNVNGLRAVVQKGFREWLEGCGADVAGIQETKLQKDHEDGFAEVAGYKAVFCSSTVKKGYSGVGAYYRREPMAVNLELPDPRFQGEGRLIHLEYPELHFFTVYFPNGQMGPDRLEYKLAYYEAFLAHAQELRKGKPVVLCGDVNTAHAPIDLKNAKSNENTSGFLPVERAFLDRFVAAGYVDTFRMFEQGGGHYTWWDYRFQARSRNVGWRIDYFFVSEELRPRVKRAWIASEVTGSDHCPVGLELEL
ncbi:MAG: exodeoxyribonuclease III [Thermodesulfobacteriota bacterium]